MAPKTVSLISIILKYYTGHQYPDFTKIHLQ
jgi:hypothetical protein